MNCIQIILVVHSVRCVHFIHFVHVGVFWINCFNFVLEKQKQ